LNQAVCLFACLLFVLFCFCIFAFVVFVESWENHWVVLLTLKRFIVTEFYQEEKVWIFS
jgi:hypothetical protein